MKKILFLLGLLLALNISYGQEILEKEIIIDSKTIIRGGDYVLVPATLGYVTKMEAIEIKYNFNTTPYTASGTDTLGIKSTWAGAESFAVIITDGLLTGSTKFLTYANDVNTSLDYSNNLILSIPTGKFTLGDSDIYIKIKYSLIK